MDNYEKLRSAGYLEKYSIARHPLGFYYNVGVTATYTLPETYTLPLRDYVYKACEILIGQHPVLSAVPVNEESDEAYFVRLPEIDLAQPVSFHKRLRGFPEGDATDTELDEYLQTQHSTGFTTPGAPYWRLAIFTDDEDDNASARRRFTAAYIFHHALGDGTSGKIFQETFLEALTTAGSALSAASGGEEAKQVVPTPVGTPLLPNLEAAHPCSISLPFLLSAAIKMKFGGRDRGLWTGAPVFTPLEARARHLVIPAPVSAAFRQSCRRNGATVTAAVQAAMAQALFAHLPPQCTKLRLTGAISVRKWLTQAIPEKSLGVWVMDFGESYWRKSLPAAAGTEETFPWKEAQRSRETIERVVGMKGKNTGVNLLKYVSGFSEFFRSKLGKPRGESIELSNIGVLSASDEVQSDPSKPQMGRVIFSQSPNAAGAAIVVSAISGGDGCLVLSFGWQQGVVEPELVSGMIDSVEKLVHLAAQ
ncbi:hypothetical protein BO86DRAFT_356320 [Aspergillus japonicus CBS 114.51]|uniref:Alcohol acetyltransferase n=2 Tax=Aspergillus TaxID=5052 RepID=A0A2V5ICH5_ASPV1|nr:hypothetical protein BO86DRAFT_356320 [Aspergillus japonicus CBS 114.51]PYI21707.1 hypothetical protein BO99DRAFT_400671 [Aspergillus violaceofuscus CBS 115571]RAH84709.1 hypothetical protein BO86DRAFT_356320 [Aspergillus japonicus CBS 114.51]